MNIKQTIKGWIPEKIMNLYYLNKASIRKNKTFEQIEKEISKEYKKKFRKELNWTNPKTYTEKLNVSKVYGSSELKANLTDKILVRDWIKEKIGEEFLIPLIGVYDKFEDIDFDNLPKQFVIKCNHDSGSVVLCKDKEKLDIKKLKEKYEFYLKRNFAYLGYEMHYKDIKPKIVIEKYMGDSIRDYKFLCFGGKPYYCWVDMDRFSNHKRNIYDLDWNLQPFNQITYGNYEHKIECPEQYEQMKEIAKILSEGFDHVRVDLYTINKKIYFGEMTFTNGNGFGIIHPEEWDYKLGELWDFVNRRDS